MLAFLRGPRAAREGLAQRVAGSLGLFAGVAAPFWRDGERIAWQLPPVGRLPARERRKQSPAFQRFAPAVGDDGTVVLFHGWFDNQADIARELGCPAGDAARLYAAAFAAWGDVADLRIVGQYCAVLDHPAWDHVRLARSPLRAPPLHYFIADDGVGVASVPRCLEAMGLPRRLNPQKLADSLYFIPTEEYGYLVDSLRVPLGTVVHADQGTRRSIRYYDPTSRRKPPKGALHELVGEVDRLLDEAAARALANSPAPGVCLTGGLDSSNLAVRVLRQLPPGAKLKSFTFVPLPGAAEGELPHGLLDERAAVQALAERHPQLEPYFTDNAAIEFDHKLETMFLAMGTGTIAAAPFFRFHGLLQLARQEGCRTLFGADAGNQTFSSSGEWAFAEYLRRGRMIQLYRALKVEGWRGRPFVRRFFSRAVIPNLPDPLWRLWKRMRGQDSRPDNARMAALRPEALARYEVGERARRAGVSFDRDQYAYREQMIRDSFARDDAEGSDLIQGWEQIYEVSYRDVPAYRPLVELCLSLPTEMFMHDGQPRWLARELGRGLLPEPQRTMLGKGQQGADWHARLTPRLADMRSAIDEIRGDPILSELIDADVLEATLDRWPEEPTLDDQVYSDCAWQLPRAVAMARYVKFMTGRNFDS